MLIKTRAIVLHHIKYGESSLIATLYTERNGRMTCMVSGVRSKKTRLPVTFFQPLTLLEAEIYYKSNRELHRIKEAACPFHYVSVPFSVIKSTIALFLDEILMLTLREEEANADLFNFLYHSFQLLDSKDEGIANFHLLFLLHYSCFLGIFPAGIASPSDISRLSDLQAFANLPVEAGNAIIQMITTSLSRAEQIVLSRSTRTVILDSLLKFYAEHLEGMGRIRSLPVLKEIFRDSP
jgi:DNA repair protein RecO (recombination protein O)